MDYPDMIKIYLVIFLVLFIFSEIAKYQQAVGC